MEFNDRVYDKLRKVPKGKVTTYKELALAVNSRAYRAVGNAMRNNPFSPMVPCHRVVNSDGTIGGFKGKKKGLAIAEKKELLENEGVRIKKGRIVNFEKICFRF